MGRFGTRRRRVLVGVLLVVVVVAGVMVVNNGPLVQGPVPERPLVLAHRGMAQTFDFAGVDDDTCTARRIHPPEHRHLENTVASMRAAFAAGADVVEFDVWRTRDDRFAVFHDYTLDCRTNGHGPVRDRTLAQLQRLDIGYGYTADGGRTYPFRGKGTGLLPSLDQVLRTFPDRQLLVDVKSNDPADGALLARRLSALPRMQQDRLTVYGGDESVAALARAMPRMRVLTKEMLVRCLVRYELLGWTGYVPAACRNKELHVPENAAPWLWGWPNVFVSRMAEHRTRVILVAGNGSHSEGFDRPADLDRLPKNYRGGVWTNRVDVVAPLLR